MSYQPLKKAIELPLGDEVIKMDITMRSLEVIERVWNESLDNVVVRLSNPGTIKRHLIADVISQWVPFGESKLSSMAVKELVMFSPAEKFSMYASLVLIVASYALHYGVTDEGFAKGTAHIAAKLKEGQEIPKKQRRRGSPRAPTK